MRPEELAAGVGDCLLCSGPPYVLGCFVPVDPGEWTNVKLKEDKTRTIWYALCRGCSEREDVVYEVEAEIMARKQAEAN